jgi:hypothetical protein
MRIRARGHWGEVSGGGEKVRPWLTRADRICDYQIKLLYFLLLITMSVAHGIKTLGVIGAGQMGTFSSFVSLPTSLPVIQASVLHT